MGGRKAIFSLQELTDSLHKTVVSVSIQGFRKWFNFMRNKVLD